MYHNLPRATPESQGISSAALAAWVDVLDRELDELHSVVVVRHGHVVAEGWWAPYAADRPHVLYSLTKSFTSTAVGLAVAEGLLSVDAKVVDFFPGVAPAKPSRFLAQLTVRHLLTMSTGRLTDSLFDAVTDRTGDWVRGFFSRPWLQAPGAPFAYDTGASHVLGVIVEKVTGTDLRAYLKPRLFEPLGIAEPSWQTDPHGHRTGGFGLSLTTEAVAKFGQLYLQKGWWEGRQLLHAAWVEAATARQVDNDRFAPGSNPDWLQGYGYQFWRGRHGSYRGDGAFGQFCVVVPERDLVVAITAATADGQPTLDRVWRLLPALTDQALAADEPAARALSVRLARLAVPKPAGARHSDHEAELNRRRFALEANPLGAREVRLGFEADRLRLTLVDGRGTHQLEAGRGEWLEATSDLLPRAEMSDPRLPPPQEKVVATFAWSGPRRLVVSARLLETPFAYTLELGFEEGWFHLDARANVSMAVPDRWPRLVGVAKRG